MKKSEFRSIYIMLFIFIICSTIIYIVEIYWLDEKNAYLVPWDIIAIFLNIITLIVTLKIFRKEIDIKNRETKIEKYYDFKIKTIDVFENLKEVEIAIEHNWSLQEEILGKQAKENQEVLVREIIYVDREILGQLYLCKSNIDKLMEYIKTYDLEAELCGFTTLISIKIKNIGDCIDCYNEEISSLKKNRTLSSLKSLPNIDTEWLYTCQKEVLSIIDKIINDTKNYDDKYKSKASTENNNMKCEKKFNFKNIFAITVLSLSIIYLLISKKCINNNVLRMYITILNCCFYFFISLIFLFILFENDLYKNYQKSKKNKILVTILCIILTFFVLGISILAEISNFLAP